MSQSITMPLGTSQSDQIWNHPATRWIAVIPGSIVAVVLTSIATAIIAAIMGSGQGTWFGMEVTSDDPNNPISKGLGYNVMKHIIQPAALTAVFVYAARVIAPARKQVVGWVFAGVSLLFTAWIYQVMDATAKSHLGVGNWLILLSFAIGGPLGAWISLDGESHEDPSLNRVM